MPAWVAESASASRRYDEPDRSRTATGLSTHGTSARWQGRTPRRGPPRPAHRERWPATPPPDVRDRPDGRRGAPGRRPPRRERGRPPSDSTDTQAGECCWRPAPSHGAAAATPARPRAGGPSTATTQQRHRNGRPCERQAREGGPRQLEEPDVRRLGREHGHPDDVDGHDEGREHEREGRRGPAHATGALHGLIIAPLTADGDGEISHAIAGRIPIPYDAEGA